MAGPDDPYAATAALAPVLDGSVPVGWRFSLTEAFLLEAIARDALGDPAAASLALARALDLAKSDGSELLKVRRRGQEHRGGPGEPSSNPPNRTRRLHPAGYET